MEKHLCCCSEREEKERTLDEIIEKHRHRQGPLIPILHEVQETFGYLPQWVQERVAERLDIPVSEVYGVVTFYAFFSMTPQGKYPVKVCLGTACYVRKGEEVLEVVKRELGIDINGTTDDRLFSLGVTRCIGACGLSPVITVGEDVYKRVKPSKVRDILESYRRSDT